MLVFFWIAAAVCVAGIAVCIGATASLLRHFRPSKTTFDAAGEAGDLSVIVPVKGADINTEENLEQLLRNERAAQCEFIFAMESAADPAYPLCTAVKERHPELRARILLTGDSRDRMGKQHNIHEALRVAAYERIASMDADVTPERGMLAEGMRALAAPEAGIVFCLPYYYGTGPSGGLMPAVHINYYFSLYVGALAALTNAPFTSGSLWFFSKRTLAAIGGMEQFTRTISDDAQIGKRTRAQGLRNIMLRRAAPMSFEQLSFADGFRHLQKWIGLLRAEGLGMFFLAFFAWHPLVFGALACIAGIFVRETIPGAAVFGAAAATKIASAALLNRSIYKRVARPQYIAFMLFYELLLIPVVFSIGFWKKTVLWKDKIYTTGKRGAIVRTQWRENC